MVVYVAATGCMPFDDRDMPKMLQRQHDRIIKQAGSNGREGVRFPVYLSEHFEPFERDILNPNPGERPTYTECARA